MVSIIIPTYNRAQILEERALASARRQSFRNYEIIVVDDCSVDETERTIKKYAGVRYFKMKENSGASAARQYGLEKARGEYIVFLDDDNELFPDFLKATVPLLDSRPDIDAVQPGRMIKYAEYEDYAPPCAGEPFCSIDWGWLIRRKVFDEIKYDPQMYGDEDADFGIRFAQKFKGYPMRAPMQRAYDAEAGTEVTSFTFPNPRRLQGLKNFIAKHEKLYKQNPNEFRYLCRLAGRNLYKAGHKTEGRKYFWKSFLARPSPETLAQLIAIYFGWRIYDWFMSSEERVGAYLRKKKYKI